MWLCGCVSWTGANKTEGSIASCLFLNRLNLARLSGMVSHGFSSSTFFTESKWNLIATTDGYFLAKVATAEDFRYRSDQDTPYSGQIQK